LPGPKRRQDGGLIVADAERQPDQHTNPVRGRVHLEHVGRDGEQPQRPGRGVDPLPRRERMAFLGELIQKYEDQLKLARDTQRNIEDQLGSKNADVRARTLVFEEVLRLRKKKLGADSPGTLAALANLGAGYREVGRLAEGISLLEEALSKGRKLPGGLPADLAWVASALAVSYDADGQFARAEPLYRGALERTRKQFGADHPQTANALGGLALNLLRQQKYVEAEQVTRACLAIRARKLPDHWQTFSTQSQLGGALLGQKKYAEAEPLLLAGYEGMKQRAARIPPPGRPRLREAVERLVELYESTHAKDRAEAWRKQLAAQRQTERRKSRGD
jgi:tetratricopeptide (TPR) repeat protein